MSTRRPGFLDPSAPPLLLFGGKGGVGKTTCACAAAMSIAVARPGERVLLVSTDPAHSVRDALADAALPPNLDVLELDAAAEHAAFMAAHGGTLAEIARRGTFLDEADIASFLELSLPGVDELMCFVRIAERLDAGGADRIVVDTAPTGHALRLLGMPGVLEGWIDAVDSLLGKHRYMAELFGGSRGGEDPVEAFVEAMAEKFEAVASALGDASRSRFVAVCNAEPLSLAETRRLLAELASLGIDAPEVIVNRVVPAEADAAMRSRRAAQAAAMRAGGPGEVELIGLSLLGVEPRGAGLTELFDAVCDAPAESDTNGPLGDATPEVEGRLPSPGPAQRLVLTAGKGGVGKTTVAAALAAERAAAGRPVLLVSTDPAGSLGDVFDAAVGPEPVEVAPRLRAMQLDAQAELDALKAMYADELEGFLDQLTGGLDLAFDREAMENLLELAPTGIDEVMALVRMTEILEAGGESEDTLLVVDTAPTGHLLRLLELPALVQRWLSAIFGVLVKYERVFSLPGVNERLLRLSRGVKALRALLEGGRCAGLYAVAVPTRVCADETTRLLSGCRGLGLCASGLVINQMTPAGSGTLTASLRAGEAEAAAAIESAAGGVAVARVERGGDIRGAAALAALGSALFADASGVRAAA